MRYVLISGASTGLGRAIALNLVRRGISVFAGVRREQDGNALQTAAATIAAGGATLRPLILDVTSTEHIQQAISSVKAEVGDRGLWALINNAGIVMPGPVEHVSLADWRRSFDVNFFGLIELTQAALPLLRQAVTVEGRLVPRLLLVSSIGGRIAQPILAPYTTTKWAVTSLGDSLRLELNRQGVGVTVIEPGAVATDIWAKGDEASRSFTPEHPARVLYGAHINGVARLAQKTAANAISAEKAAEAIVKTLFQTNPPARVLVGPDAKIGAALRKWLPLRWFDQLLRKQFDF